VVNTSVSYSRSSDLESETKIYVVFFSLSRTFLEKNLKIGYHSVFPHSFQFIIYNRSTSQHYVTHTVDKASLTLFILYLFIYLFVAYLTTLSAQIM
jgi:hypothetical protein